MFHLFTLLFWRKEYFFVSHFNDICFFFFMKFGLKSIILQLYANICNVLSFFFICEMIKHQNGLCILQVFLKPVPSLAWAHMITFSSIRFVQSCTNLSNQIQIILFIFVFWSKQNTKNITTMKNSVIALKRCQ